MYRTAVAAVLSHVKKCKVFHSMRPRGVGRESYTRWLISITCLIGSASADALAKGFSQRQPGADRAVASTASTNGRQLHVLGRCCDLTPRSKRMDFAKIGTC
jgi:hypothetical protein